MNLQLILEEFGLSQRQASVYLANLELGEATATQIAEKAQIERTGTYYVLEGLRHKGLIHGLERGKKDCFTAVEPKEILNIARRRERLISDNLREFEAFANLASDKPHVRLYTGIEGVKTVFNKTLENKNSRILGFSPYKTAEKTAWYNGREYVEWGFDYIKRRVAKHIVCRTISEDSEEARLRQKNDMVELRETRLVPHEKFFFSNEIAILDEWVAIISYREMVALEIRSKGLTNTLKSVFELAWDGAERYTKE